MKKRSIVFFLLWMAATAALGQASKRQLTIEDIYDRAKRIAPAAGEQRGFTWVDDTHFYWPRTTPEAMVTGFALVDTTTGEVTALFDPDELQAQISKVDGVSADEARRIARPRSITVDWGTRGVLLSMKNDLYIYNIQSKSLSRLTSSAGQEEQATFSPDGKLVAFVRDHNLFTIDVGSKAEHQLTIDGTPKIFNGRLDWVYEEEVYGRGLPRAYWWSADSKSIAYLRVDDTNVPDFTVVDHIPGHQKLEVTPYPLAGDPNPVATLHIADLATGASVRVDQITDPAATLIVDVSWKPDSSAVDFQVQDREQTYLDLNEVPRAGGQVRQLLHETTKAWVNNNGSPFWLKDGSFLWASESTGWEHIYRVSAKGRTAITSGDWEVRAIFGVDEKNGWIYYSSTERSPIGVDVYRVRLDGSRKQRLTERAGTHTAKFNPSLTRFADNWSDVTTPPQLFVSDVAGKAPKLVLDTDAKRELSQFDLGTPEFVNVKTRDGFVMEAMILRPPHFDAARKYPVYEYTYSGPHAPQVRNAWGGSTYLFHQLLAEKGIVVWICDNRTASGKGAISAWPLYRNFGELELRDLEDGLSWLTSNPWIDGSRLLLSGWSFGGFMTTYALTHSTKWSAGIAGGSVTTWHDYDSIYTERYMLTPEHNKDGYERTAPQKAAANLHGSLLLLHGAIDDNVHVQNTIQFVYALQKAGKQFELMLYPKSRHGVLDPDLVKQMRTLMIDFAMRNLKP
ncbi:MAG TPA: S9 family peptidase [Thermoanaerobaculia bacterium]|nr:S9 family peptidase [Thermoanaerobaculia bacterium]